MRTMHKVRVGIYGATGYSGVELVQLLARHPHAEIEFLASEQKAGLRFGSVFGATGNLKVDSLKFLSYSEADRAVRTGIDFLFLATPAEASRKLAIQGLEAGARVIDLSGAFRLSDEQECRAHYGMGAEAAPYGLPEWNRSLVKDARLLANPGCYATAMNLALAPLVDGDLLSKRLFTVSAVSGTSGAGRKAQEDYSFGQITGDLRAYRILHHQHTPEVEQFLQGVCGAPVQIAFVPQLGSFDRGILATCFFEVKPGVSLEQIRERFVQCYRDEAFVQLTNTPEEVRLHHVVGTNGVEIGVGVDPRTHQGVVVVAIDNLIKGAAGQALQNFNAMNGFDEGITLKGLRRTYS